jgi:hypothetical protein
MRAVIAGDVAERSSTDRSESAGSGDDGDDLGDAIAAEGIDVRRIDGLATAEKLADAGIEDATVFAITDVVQATAIPVARELNDGLRIVVYTDDSLPEFARPLADLILDPDLFGPEAVAEELAEG